MDQKLKLELTGDFLLKLFTGLIAILGFLLLWVDKETTNTRNELRATIMRIEDRIIEEIKDNKADTNKRLDLVEGRTEKLESKVEKIGSVLKLRQ